MKTTAIWILSHLAFVVIGVCIVCLISEKQHEKAIEEVRQEIQTQVEPKVLKIIEKVEEPAEEKDEEPESLGVFKMTAYCSCEKCCGVWAKNRPTDEAGKEIVIGSAGKRLFAGKSIAVDPSVIPYGSVVEINGKEYSADDCGGAIKGNHIDVYFENHDDALIFGVQYAEVFVG